MTHYIERIRASIEAITRKPGPSPLFSPETLLFLLSILYGGVMAMRAALYRKGLLTSRKLPCRVISIGNIVAGGTGKTPFAIFVARTLHGMGRRVVVISRGYRGGMEKEGGIVSDGSTILVGPEEAGDEPYLMAASLKGVPVVVGADRFAAGRVAIQRFNPDAIVLDDAFQHLKLKRDIDLLLMDRRLPLGNGYLLPRGRLREPVSALKRCQAIILTRSDQGDRPCAIDPVTKGRPTFHTMHQPILRMVHRQVEGALDLGPPTAISFVEGKKIVAFSGLANNEQFFNSLESLGGKLVGRFSFVDHCTYEDRQIEQIALLAMERKADLLATTLKDYVKMAYCSFAPPALLVVDVGIRLRDNEDAFRRLLIG